MKLSAKQLDLQSKVIINEWLDFDSDKCKQLDDNRDFTKKCLKYGFEDGYMFTDEMGRVWGENKQTGEFYPFHFNIGKKLYGYRLSKKAAN